MIVTRNASRIFILILVFVLSVFVSNGTTGSDSDLDSNMGSISGRVLPVDSNATVYLISSGTNPVIVDSKKIMIDGGYLFENVMPDMYAIIIVPESSYVNDSRVLIGVRKNATTVLSDVSLSRIGETGSISGHVSPIIPDIVVRINKFGGDPYYYAIVDDEGKFLFKDLVPGTYALSIEYTSTSDFYPYRRGMFDVFANETTAINALLTPRNNTYFLDRLMVTFSDSLSEKEIREIIISYGCSVISHYSYSTLYVILIPEDKTIDEMTNTLKRDSRISEVYPDGISFSASAVSENYSSNIMINNIIDINKALPLIFETSRYKDDSEKTNISIKSDDLIDSNHVKNGFFYGLIQFFKSLYMRWLY